MDLDLDTDIEDISKQIENQEKEKESSDGGQSRIEKELNNILQRTYMAGYNEAEMKSTEEKTELYVIIANTVTTLGVLLMMYHQFYM